MTEFLKNMKKPLLAAFLGATIFIAALLTGPNLNTVSGDSLGCVNGICDVALICDSAACNTCEIAPWTPPCKGRVDVPLREHLIALGHIVTNKNDDDNRSNYNPTAFDVVVISDSADSIKTNWLKDEAVGILTLDALPNPNANRFCLASIGDDNRPVTPWMTVTNNTHYITKIFNGTRIPPFDVDVGGGTEAGGNMRGWEGYGVLSLGHYQGLPPQSKLLVVEKRGTLVSFGTGGCQFAGTAADRRVFFGARLFGNLTNDGKEVFDHAFNWAARLDPVAASNGSLESSTFDTGITDGVAFNSIMWQGTSGTGIVKFQLASSNSSVGPWNFLGPGGNPTAYYQPSSPGVPVAISTLDHNNKRYFRYRVFLEGAAATTPVVQDIIINWSP